MGIWIEFPVEPGVKDACEMALGLLFETPIDWPAAARGDKEPQAQDVFPRLREVLPSTDDGLKGADLALSAARKLVSHTLPWAGGTVEGYVGTLEAYDLRILESGREDVCLLEGNHTGIEDDEGSWECDVMAGYAASACACLLRELGSDKLAFLQWQGDGDQGAACVSAEAAPYLLSPQRWRKQIARLHGAGGSEAVHAWMEHDPAFPQGRPVRKPDVGAPAP